VVNGLMRELHVYPWRTMATRKVLLGKQ
jgi:hypothetical protein